MRVLVSVLMLVPGLALASDFETHQYAVTDGLSDPTVWGLMQSRDGRLWAFTPAGVSIFDGRGFESLSPREHFSGGMPFDGCEHPDGRVFLTTSGFAQIWDGQRARAISDLNARSVQCADDGSVWWTGRGPELVVMRGEETEHYPLPSTGRDLWLDGLGRVWVDTANGELLITERGAPPREVEVSGVVQALSPTAKGVVVATEEGLFTHDGATARAIDVSLDGAASVTSLHPAADGSTWIGTSEGLHLFRGDQIVDQLKFDQDLASRQVADLLEDREGNLWVGHLGEGLERIRKAAYTDLTQALTERNVGSLGADFEGGLWVATMDGTVARFVAGEEGLERTHFYPLPPGSPSPRVIHLLAGDGAEAWVSRGSGIERLGGEQPTSFDERDGLPAAPVWSGLRDSKRQMWFGTHRGLAKWEGSRFVTLGKEQGLPDPRVYSLVEYPEGQLWAGTAQGLARWEGDRFVTVGEIPAGIVSGLAVDAREQLWATVPGQGLFRIDVATGKTQRWTTSEGLPEESLYSLALGSDDALFIGGSRGVYHFDGSRKNFRVVRGPPRGFGATPYNRQAVYIDPEGRVWIGASHGLFLYRPDRDQPNESPPLMRMVNTRLFMRERLDRLEGAELEAEDNHLTFDFAGVSLTRPTDVRYRYRLVGFDMDWSPLSTDTRAIYTNLPPGPYRFEATAQNEDGVWAKEPVQVAFSIRQPLHHRPWFIAVMGALLLGAALLAYRVRIGLLWRRERQLQAEVALRTEELETARNAAERATAAKSEFLANMSHEIRTPLNGIMGMTQVLQDTPQSAEQAELTSTILSSGHILLSLINDVLDFSKIEAGHLEVEQAPFHLGRCIEEAMELVVDRATDKSLTFVARVPREIDLHRVGDVTRLRQVMVNLLGNAVKFTSEGSVMLFVEAEPEYLHFWVADTGIGIPDDRLDRLFRAFSQVDASTTRRFGGTGLGLAISRRLAEAMGGDMWVESEVGAGSEFHFVVPLEVDRLRRSRWLDDEPDLAHVGGLVVVDPSEHRRGAAEELGERLGLRVRAYSEASELGRLVANDVVLAWTSTFDEVRHRIEAARGEAPRIVEVKSTQPEPGTRLQLRAPLRARSLIRVLGTSSAQLTSSLSTPRDSQMAESHPLRILVADDNPVNRKVAGKLLQRLGYAPEFAENGEEALEAVRAQRFDLVLMDIHMPVMDGLEATRRIRAEVGAEPRVIALTAGVSEDERRACDDVGMQGFLTKPIDYAALRGTLIEEPAGG